MSDQTVRDVMLALGEYATIGMGCTIHEALVELSKTQLGLTYDRHHHRAILVIGPDGDVAGKVTHWALLRSLMPELLGDEELASLTRAGLPDTFIERLKRQVGEVQPTLRGLCRAAARVKVEDAMVPVGDSIDVEATLIEAIQRMVAHHCQSMIVRRRGAAVGILRLSDVFEEVADVIRAADPGDSGGE
ncbi:MAG: CBS domain-containing protein [Deltaproteobacteria bacterium]|nr:CBS domain-containing protein [Deltaproteobacteria bacterium]